MVSGEGALRAAVFAALKGDAGLAAAVNGIFDGPQGQASPPFIRLDEGVAVEWGAKGLEGAELRLTVAIVDAGQTPERLGRLVGMVDAAAKGAAGAQGWRVVNAVMLRTRTARGKDGRWTAAVEYRLRGVRD